MNFEQDIEIIVANKQAVFLRATPEETKKFPHPNLKLINPMQGIEYHWEAIIKGLQVSWVKNHLG